MILKTKGLYLQKNQGMKSFFILCKKVSKPFIYAIGMLGALLFAFCYSITSCVVDFCVSFIGVIKESHLSMYATCFPSDDEDEGVGKEGIAGA